MSINGAVRNIITRATGSVPMFGVTDEAADVRGQAASDLIKKELLSEGPLLICRFGSNELNILIGYCYPASPKNYARYFTSQVTNIGWSNKTVRSFITNAGFFPDDDKYLKRYAEMTLDDFKYIDILGTWLRQEQLFKSQLARVKKIPLQDMEPYYHSRPWTEALAGKKVLVIHPFEESIQQQYKKRDALFSSPSVLPDFQLRTIKAVQSVANNCEGYDTWFDALESMKTMIDNCDFEIAILGCGAYGFPLAAHIKRMCKKAIHMGGATQLLFGISGARWEHREFYKDLINEHWIKPLPVDRPKGFHRVENGCYW